MPPDASCQGMHPHLTWHSDTILDGNVLNKPPMTSSFMPLARAGKAYKRHRVVTFRVLLPWVIWGWGIHMHRDWHANAPMFLEPTSFKDNQLVWVVCYHHGHPHHVEAFTHSGSIPGALPFFLLVPFCRTAIPLVGARVHWVHGVTFSVAFKDTQVNGLAHYRGNEHPIGQVAEVLHCGHEFLIVKAN